MEVDLGDNERTRRDLFWCTPIMVLTNGTLNTQLCTNGFGAELCYGRTISPLRYHTIRTYCRPLVGKKCQWWTWGWNKPEGRRRLLAIFVSSSPVGQSRRFCTNSLGLRTCSSLSVGQTSDKQMWKISTCYTKQKTKYLTVKLIGWEGAGEGPQGCTEGFKSRLLRHCFK